MHLFEKNGAPWSETVHKIGLLLFVIMISYGVAIAEYKNASAGSTIVIEQALVGVDARIDTESVSDSIAPNTKDEVEDGVSVKPQVNREDVVAMIAAAFPENQGEMLKIGRCESQLSSDRVGDLGIRFEKDGKLYGSSHGIFQIRALPGRTDDPDQFAEDMKNPKKNIEAAKRIFDGQGYKAWYNCAVKEGLI